MQQLWRGKWPDWATFGRLSLAWLRLLWHSLQAALAPDSALTAAAISYFTLFSLFPLTLLTVAIGSLWIDPMLAESAVVTRLEFAAPALGELLGANIERIVRARGPITGFAGLTLLWSASNIFNVLTRAADRVWSVDEKRPSWRRRGLAILIVLVISGLLLAASFAESIIWTILNVLLPDQIAWMQPYTDQFWAVFLSVALFAALYYFLPHIKLTWRQVLPGAIGAGILWELAKQGFLYFVASYLSRSNLVYGSFATITVFLTWAYFSSIIFMFGAHLNVQYQRLRTG
ncbi:MAG: YihY/virulence factor BrkB family protein [Ardenticatenaceae bacterium]|nr:YihY/virulence factor BrkB family protein [Ardenticatenaceae bacterium]